MANGAAQPGKFARNAKMPRRQNFNWQSDFRKLPNFSQTVSQSAGHFLEPQVKCCTLPFGRWLLPLEK